MNPTIRAKAEDNIRKAKVQLVLYQPFYASIVLKRDIQLRDDVPTAYMTAGGQMVLGTEFVSKQTVAQTVGLMAHEASHYAFLHHMRLGWRKPRPANVAMDKVINDILLNSGMELPDGGVTQADAREYAWEQLYKEDEGGGGGGDQYQPGNGNDDLSMDGLDKLDAEQVQQIKQELIQAAMAAKSRGNMPAGLEGLVDKIVNPRTPWHQLLERHMLLMIKANRSWRRPNKRFIGQDLYMQSAGQEPRMGTVVVVSDESGSVGNEERRHFAGHFNAILEQCKPEKVHLLHVDTQVHKAEEFSVEDLPIEFKTYACGGTDMTAAFRWVEENGIEPDVMVFLTDGETPFGEPPGYPVVWLITTDAVAPHGETIPYEVTEEK